MHNENDTICALATPTRGAIAVVRVSGSQCYPIVEKLLKTPIANCAPNTLRHTTIYSINGTEIDDVVLSLYRAPHSYTGENSIEISCHGSRYIVHLLLDSLTKAGCRQAEPGEYTRRAYLNGKMDLSQAEAVADLISSSNRTSHQLAISQLKGHVKTELESLRDRLLKLTSLLELELDFSDHEDLTFANRDELLALAENIEKRVSRLADSYRTGKAIKEGIPVAIVGKTNVGKSTLLNQLLGEERALVSDVHGTTRDSIEDTTVIDGLMFRFVDTAGIRHTDDLIEQMGIDRTWEKLQQALIVLWVIDELPSEEEMELMMEQCKNKKLLLVFNKTDIQTPPSHTISYKKCGEAEEVSFTCYPISAKTGAGIPELEAAIWASANVPELQEGDIIITSARQFGLLSNAREGLLRVIDGLQNSLPSDLVAEDLKLVLDTLGDATGVERITPQATLNNIFSSFCVGK